MSYSTLHTIRQLKKEFKGHLQQDFLVIKNSKNDKVVLAVWRRMWPNIAYVHRDGINVYFEHEVTNCCTPNVNMPPIGIANRVKSAYFVYHLMVKTRRYYLRDMSLVTPQSLLLFCGKVEDAEIEYGKREIIIDGWIRVHVASKCAVLLLNLRQEISAFLLQKYLDPDNQNNGIQNKLTDLLVAVLNSPHQ